MKSKPIYVTQPYLPPLEEFIPYLREIWESKILTNGGPFHQQLEKALCEYLGVKHISLFTNATIALVTALQALRITGEVITTPYSLVATAHSILWNGALMAKTGRRFATKELTFCRGKPVHEEVETPMTKPTLPGG